MIDYRNYPDSLQIPQLPPSGDTILITAAAASARHRTIPTLK